MLFAVLVIGFTIIAGIVGAVAAWGAPVAAIPIGLAAVVAGGLLALWLEARKPPVVRERERVEFEEDDYQTLAHRPEHAHGHVERGPTRPPGATP